MNRLRLPLRLARREVWRRPGRSALVALLVAIPVMGMALAVVLIRSEAETPAEDWEQENGQADAKAFDTTSVPLDLPDGARAASFQWTYLPMKTEDGRRADVEVTTLPIGDPLAEGIYELVAGRAATSDGEVVLTSKLADRLDVHVGDRLVLERPVLDVAVVGEAERTTCLSCMVLLLHTDLGDVDGATGRFGETSPSETLVDLPDDLTADGLVEVRRLNPRLALRVDALAMARPEVDGDGAVRWSLVLGAVVLMVVAIVISAAFAVGARRQLVTLGQLSASGAPPSTIRASLVLQGTVTGLVGSAVGLVLAGVALITLRGRLELLIDQRLRGYDVPLTELVAVVLIGAGAATASALIPARTAARIPTLAALAGRRPLSPVSRRLISWGIGSVVAGLALLFLAVLGGQSGSGDVWALVAILGGALELVGACALAPAVVARLEPWSARLRGSLRLGARTLARHRARTGAVVSAVAAAGALAVVAGALVLGSERQDDDVVTVPDDVIVATSEHYDDLGQPVFGTPLPATARSGLEETFPDARSAELRALDFGTAGGGQPFWETVVASQDGPYLSVDRVYVADETVLDALRADGDVRAALRDHGIVLITGEAGEGDTVVRTPDGQEIETRVVQHGYQLGYGSQLLVTPGVADELGARLVAAGTFLVLPEPLSGEDRDRLNDLYYELTETIEAPPGSEEYVQLAWHDERGGPTPLQLELILTGVAFVFCLFVIGVSLALAAAEGKDERDILTIAGAPPGMVARSAGARAWLMATLGAAIAVPIGFLPVVVGSWASGKDPNTSGAFPIVFPTRTVLLLLVLVPLSVCAVAWAASATAQRLRPVRISTATFE